MLGTALASGLQTYSAISDEVRRRRLHDLQVEGATLRNYGLQRQNEFYDDTYDRRVGTVDSQGRKADASAAIEENKLAFQEWSRPYLERQTQLATAKAGHDNRYAAARASDQELTLRKNAATADLEVQATNDQNRLKSVQAQQEYATELRNRAVEFARADVVASRSVDELFHSPRFQGVAVGVAEGLYGGDIAAIYGEGAQVVGFMPVGDGSNVVAVVDTDGDGEWDERADEAAFPTDQFLVEVLGEDEGTATFQRLMQGQMALNERQAQNSNQAEGARGQLERLTAAQQQYDAQGDTVHHYHNELNRIEQERASLARPSWANIDPVTGARTGPSRAEIKTRQDELDAEEAQILEAAETLGINEDYLRSPELFEQQRTRQGENIQRLSEFTQAYDSGQLDAHDRRQMRTLSALGEDPRRGMGMPERLDPYQQAERVRELSGSVLESLDDDLKGLLTETYTNDRGTRSTQVDSQRVAEIRMQLQDLVTMHESELSQRLNGPRGKQEVEMILRESARQSVRHRVPVEAAFTTLLGENAQDAEAILAFRSKLEQGGLLRNYPALRGLAPEQLASMFDEAQQYYGELVGSGTSPQAAERAVLGQMASQAR